MFLSAREAELTGCDQTKDCAPGQPGDLVKGLDRRKDKGDNQGDSDKDSRANSVHAHGIQCDTAGTGQSNGSQLHRIRYLPDGEQRRTNDSDHENPVDGAENLTTDRAEPHVSDIGDAVCREATFQCSSASPTSGQPTDFRMSPLEITNDPIRPRVHGADHQHEDHAWHYTECVQCRGDRQHTQTDLHFHHDDTCACPAQL